MLYERAIARDSFVGMDSLAETREPLFWLAVIAEELSFAESAIIFPLLVLLVLFLYAVLSSDSIIVAIERCSKSLKI